MKKISKKLWTYSIIFLTRSVFFNLALIFSIIALVYVSDGMTLYASLAIAFAGSWLLLNLSGHFTWSKLSKNERALYFGIRRHGPKVVQVTKAEIERRGGQQDSLEILRDTDSSLEVMMLINGTFSLINILVGSKWISAARKFNKNNDSFDFEIVDKEV